MNSSPPGSPIAPSGYRVPIQVTIDRVLRRSRRLHALCAGSVPVRFDIRRALRRARVLQSPRRQLPILAGVAAALAGLVGYALWREVRAPTLRAKPGIVLTPFSLRAASERGAVRLYWDQSAVGKASSGELIIVDGEETIRRVVDEKEIQSGGLAYRPLTGDVTFFLSAYGPNGFAANQVLRWIEPPQPDARPKPVVLAAGNPDPAGSQPAAEVKPRSITPARQARAAVRRAPVVEPPAAPPLTEVKLPAPPSAVVETAVHSAESPKPREETKPHRREVAEVMPAREDDAEQANRPRDWKRPLRWLHGKTSRIWPFGRKPATSEQ